MDTIRRIAFFICFIFMLILVACKKLISVPPPISGLSSQNVYLNDATAAAVFTGIYTELSASNPTGASTIGSISLACGLSADELTLFDGSTNANTSLVQFYLNNVSPGSPTDLGIGAWNDFYSRLYIVNIALENLTVSSDLTPSVRQQLLGEAKFLRAFFHFYLVNLYGDIPMILTSNYLINSKLPRTDKSLVYQQIVSDLADARNLLSDGYVASDAKSNTSERIRPNKWAATALLARAYLYEGNYDSSEIMASSIIANSSLYDSVSLNNVFLKNSKEAIWQLQPVNAGWNTEDARIFVLPASGPTNNSTQGGFPVYMSPQLLGSFENGDERRMSWVDSVSVNGNTYYYPYKYKSATLGAAVTEYLMVLRLGEQYLIRAESRARQNRITDALGDLNLIRARAGLSPVITNNQNFLLSAILKERQVELFTEWGHRWLDLKRTGSLNNVMNKVAPAKGTTWNPDWQYYPIPLYDISRDQNLVQNPGY